MNADIAYWERVHSTKYLKSGWITKPTIFATQALKYFPETGTILELGCGQGQDSVFFAQNGYQVLATDFSPFALAQALQKTPQELNSQIKYQALDISQPLSVPHNSFDIVYSHLAIHYFDAIRTQALFDEIFSVLKPGGIFAALTNTIADPEVAAATIIEPEYYQCGEIKKRFFSVDSMKKYASKFEPLLLNGQGETHKDAIKTLIRFVGRKPNNSQT